MPKFNVFNMAGQVTGEVELSEAVFGVTPNEQALHESVKNHLANQRQGTQSALTRAEVSGGGIKPYRQKGTGRARQGSTRAPHYTHGGIAFAPKPRDYSYTINKKLKKLALKSALSQKAIDNAIVVVESIDMDNIKTQEFVKFLKAVGVNGKALVVTPEVRDSIVKSARNIPGVQTTIATILNAYDVLNAATFVVDKAALATIEEVYA
jgi:large subunit ribosomal protein L4